MTPWRTRTSVREGLGNVSAAPFLFGILTVVGALLCGGAAVADLVVTQRVLEAEQQFIDAGGDILRATPDEGTITAASCHELGHLPGVVAVSAVSQVTAQLAGKPEHLQTVLLATPGIERIVEVPELAPGEAIVGAVLGERWSWDEGTALDLAAAPGVGLPWPTPPGMVTVGALPDLSRLGDAASTSIIVPQPVLGEVGSCLVRVEPQLIDVVAKAVPAALGEAAPPVIRVDRQVYTGQFGPDPSTDFLSRPTQWAGLVAGAVLGLVCALVTWTRRQRAALYATIGVPWSGGVQIRLTEALVPVVAGAAWGAVWSGTAGVVLGLPAAVVLPTVLLHAGAALSAACTVVVIAALWRPPTLQALKDR